MKILFLDIDGCLNTHDPFPTGHCRMHADKLALLDDLVARAGCRIILASAWRYLMLRGEMVTEGFRELMLTHGASRRLVAALDGYLPADRDLTDLNDRGKLARDWLAAKTTQLVLPHIPAVALDDLDLGYTHVGIPLVLCRRTVGLTPDDVCRAVELFDAQE